MECEVKANSGKTLIKTCLIVAPLNVQLNWVSEFKQWIPDDAAINVFTLPENNNTDRLALLRKWRQEGGVLVIGYTLFHHLLSGKNDMVINDTLLNPGPDLVICDEGHVLKRSTSQISQILQKIRTQRRVILTGTPLQNNLKEYHCMVSFVRPNLLGNEEEFDEAFVKPIKRGESKDATDYEVTIMKRRICVLHRRLAPIVHRRGVEHLRTALLPKFEYALMLRSTEKQTMLYANYLRDVVQQYSDNNVLLNKRLFSDFVNLQYIVNHPYLLYVARENAIKEAETCGDMEVASRKLKQIADVSDTWFTSVVWQSCGSSQNISSKIHMLFRLLRRFERMGEKTLIFSQSVIFLDHLETLLAVEKHQRGPEAVTGLRFNTWRFGEDYFRIDGSVPALRRDQQIKRFNDTSDERARLFLISTRAGGIGITLTAASRCIISDVSWNPCNDAQAVFRAYRFGQTKPVFIYRLVASGTMEEKIFKRQIQKQALSHRVVDEKQIQRHYYQDEVGELYKFDPSECCILHGGQTTSMTKFRKPEDDVLAELLYKFSDVIDDYLDYDSLLAHQEAEELSEEERLSAWREFEKDESLQNDANEHSNDILHHWVPKLPLPEENARLQNPFPKALQYQGKPSVVTSQFYQPKQQRKIGNNSYRARFYKYLKRLNLNVI